MKANRFNGRRITGMAGIPNRSHHHQRGVVLLIALIMLVAMTLAGIGMMRSIDTGSVIAGNLAFKQATTNATDDGTNYGYSALMAVANSANSSDKLILNFSDNGGGVACPAGTTAVNALTRNATDVGAAGCTAAGGGTINFPGYSSIPLNNCEVLGTCTTAQSQWWATAANWANAPSVTVTDPNNPAGTPIATVSYLVHRMCSVAGAAPTAAGQTCQTYTVSATGCSHGVNPPPCTQTLVFYRITAMSVGVRNTVSYTQTLALVAL